MALNLKIYLICKLCNSTYEDPIILPCGKTICSKHAYLETTEKNFKCNLCNHNHPVTSEGFLRNEDLYNLVNVSNNFIHRDLVIGTNNKNAQALCKELEQLIIKFELLAYDPTNYIHEYFSNLKADLDLSREKCIQTIEERYFNLLNEVETAEKNCKSNVNENSFSQEFWQSIEYAKENLEEFNGSSTKADLNNDRKWNDFKYEIEKTILLIDYQLKKYEDKLLNGKTYEFEPNKNVIDFGRLHVSNKKISRDDEYRLQAKIRLKIENFKSLKHDEKQLIKSLHIIDNIPWIISVCLITQDNLESILKVCIEPEINFAIMNKNEINAALHLRVLKTDGSISKNILFKPCKRKFMPFEPYNQHRFSLKLAKLMNEQNQIFNSTENSIQFEIAVDILSK